MPLRDHSLNLNIILSHLMREEINSEPKEQFKSKNEFCILLFKKYYECTKKTKNPLIDCQSENEIIHLTRCAELLEYEKLYAITKKSDHSS